MPTVLIVDDDPLLQDLLSQILLREGHKVVQAENGEDALRLFRAEIPDLVVLDVDMGEGLSGFEVCRLLRKDPLGNSIAILFLSGMNSEENLIIGLQEGADDYIKKPFQVKEFVARVKAQLARLQRMSKRFPSFGSQQFKLGHTINGSNNYRYKITKRLASGGMGVIFKGYRIEDNLPVAIKTINNKGNDNHKDFQRFMREARATLKIQHPNIAAGLDIVSTSDHCFFVMEYVDGDDLAVILDRQRSLPPEKSLDIILQISKGLEYLHQEGMVHRDIKPGNILVDPDGRAVLVDMGLTKPVHTEVELTTEGVILGTPYYLSPEQALGEPIDIRSDIYSLGTTFYHLLTGTLPFNGASTLAIVNARLINSPEPIKEHVRSVDPLLSPVVVRMIERFPEKRYQEPKELIQELEAVKEQFDKKNQAEQDQTS